MRQERLRRLSRVKPAEMDSVAHSKTTACDRRRAVDVLMEAQHYWDNMAKFRDDRERNKRYTYGDQWSDVITADGVQQTEEQYIKGRGQVPLKNNMIRRLVRNVMGVYRGQSKEPTCVARDRDEQQLGEVMSTTLQYNMQLNRMNEVYARTMEEFLISGFAVHRKWYGWRNDKLDCWTDYVQPNNFFIDCNMRDFRGWDVTCLGEVHDIDFGTLVGQFAESKADYALLAEIYRSARDKHSLTDYYSQFGYSDRRDWSFLYPTDHSRCRVIEVWRKEQKPRYRCHDYNSGEVYKIEVEDYAVMVEEENAKRIALGASVGMAADDIPLIEATWFVDDYWYYYYLSPMGDILKEGETPYAHKSHPYVFKAYPFIDGEVHSYVNDVIDQQRYTNRLVTMYDWIMRASAKGVLLVPEDCLGDRSPSEFADEWSRVDGVLFYKAKPGVPAPTQVASNATNIGIGELLNLQLKFFEDISGVHGALQGRGGNSGTSGTLYAQQAQNAATSLLDLLDAFSDFVTECAYKDVKNINQFYDNKRYFNVAGDIVEYDPEKIQDVEWDISITESTTTPAYRQMANDFLMQIWSSGQITLQQLLETGNFPFADKLLQSVSAQQEQLQQGQTPEALPEDLTQQVQERADMGAVQRAHDMISGNDAAAVYPYRRA